MKRISLRSIQSQLILYFTIATLVPAGITAVVGIKLIYNQIITRAETKTLSDLNSAREIYRNNLSHLESITRLTAVRSLVIGALAERDRQFFRKDLAKTLQREHLDILTIVDTAGIVIGRGRNPAVTGDTLRSDRLIARVLADHRIVTATEIVPGEELARESQELAERAMIEATPTPKAKERKEQLETSGMMLESAVPVFDDANVFRGVLLGGILLNRSSDIVDKIKEVIHEREIYKGREIGTATIFQNDLRISTNVKNQDGSRAIGTLVSGEVHDAVLNEGIRFVGEAFVVNAWYIAAYEPIRDIDNRIIGILYVGVLKQPFDDVLRNALITFLGITIIGVALIISVAVNQAKRISRPLKGLQLAAGAIADGDYRTEEIVNAPLEIEHLASSINQMAKKLEVEKRELEEWGTTLEHKVQERAEEIKRIHSQLFRSEKLASIGKLAAGVAHEINNPLTGILTNSSLLVEDLDKEDPRREDVEVIVKETIRCREIVKRLLDFARQTKPQKKLTDVNAVIENIILLVRNQASFRNIVIDKRLTPGIPPILADTDQIQQVFVNIILNAAEAMPNGGTLTISTDLPPSDNVVAIAFADTGLGIAESNRERIFDPFFTTKEHGTGLGLAISYGIVEQHGGTINVTSSMGKGSRFTIELPLRPAESEDP